MVARRLILDRRRRGRRQRGCGWVLPHIAMTLIILSVASSLPVPARASPLQALLSKHSKHQIADGTDNSRCYVDFRTVRGVGTRLRSTCDGKPSPVAEKLAEMFQTWFPNALSRDTVLHESLDGSELVLQSHLEALSDSDLDRFDGLRGEARSVEDDGEGIGGFRVSVEISGNGTTTYQASLLPHRQAVRIPVGESEALLMSRAMLGSPGSMNAVEVHEFELFKAARGSGVARGDSLDRLCVDHLVPPILAPVLSSSAVEVRPRSDEGEEGGGWKSVGLLDGSTVAIAPAARSGGASRLTVCLNANELALDKASAVRVKLSHRKVFPSVFSLPADRSAGIYYPATSSFASDGEGDIGSHQISSLPLRVLSPLPDCSMPYNACIITTTVYALAFGWTAKSAGHVIRPETRSRGQRAAKAAVNLGVLAALFAVVWVVDSETRYQVREFFGVDQGP